MKKTGLYGHVYDFSNGCDIIDVADVSDIHQNLIIKHNIK